MHSDILNYTKLAFNSLTMIQNDTGDDRPLTLGVHNWTQYKLSTATNYSGLRVQRHRTAIAIAATAIAAHSPRQMCRRDTLSTIFTIVGVQKSVSARRLLGSDHLT